MSTHTLPKYDLQELADTMLAVLDGPKDQMIYWFKLQKLLLEGRPVSPKQVAAALQISQDAVSSLLRGAELDQEGNVVGMGLSLVPTPHSYRIEGRQFYVWCAVDAITFPIFHKTNVVIESPDPVSGEKIRLMGTPEGANDVNPSTTVVTWVPKTESFETIRASFCNFTHFFTSVETASQYVSQHPGLLIVPVDDIFQIGKLW